MSRIGQATAEYAILIAVVTAVFLGMQLYTKRGLQAGIKMAADSLSPVANDPQGEEAQREGMRFEAGERTNRTFTEGEVRVSEAASRRVVDQSITSTVAEGGATTRTIAAGADTTTVFGALEDRGEGVAQYSEVIFDTGNEQ